MDSLGSPNFETRQAMVRQRVIARLLRTLEPPEALRGKEDRQRAHWNEFGAALIRRIPGPMMQGEIEHLLDSTLDDWFERNRYRTWPMAADVLELMEPRVKAWYDRKRESEHAKRALPAPKVDPLTGFRDHGWTVESAERWIKELERDVNHPFQKSMIGMAQAALERCQARRDGSAELRHQRENFFPDSDRHADERRRSIERAEGEPHDWKDQGDAA